MQPSRFALDTIQGNIWSPFRRDHYCYLMLRFVDGAEAHRERLKEALREHVTSAKAHDDISATWRASGGAAKVGMFGLAHPGYEKLGWRAPSDGLGITLFEKGPHEVSSDPTKARYYIDLRTEELDVAYRQRVHAFLLLASNEPKDLLSAAESATADLQGIAEVCAREWGRRGPAGPGGLDLEHFGFVDQVSKQVTPNDVLPEDAAAEPGCFAAFLKIEQNVRAFDKKVEELRQAFAGKGLELSTDDAAARVIGRSRNGDPLVAHTEPDAFTFEGDPDGLECPMHSHIRVMNRRDGNPPLSILRRGVSYGPPAAPESDFANPPYSTRGLLFLSLHRSMADFLLAMNRANTLHDPILSRPGNWNDVKPSGCPNMQTWKIKGQTVCYPFADVTTFRGGEYFYIPPMSFFDAAETPS